MNYRVHIIHKVKVEVEFLFLETQWKSELETPTLVRVPSSMCTAQDDVWMQ